MRERLKFPGGIRRKRRHAITLLEILLAVTVLAAVILPLGKSLISPSKASGDDECEVEALDKACEMLNEMLTSCEFDMVPFIPSSHPKSEDLKSARIKYSIEWKLVPMATNFYIHTLKYHDPCADGIETNTGLTIGEDNARTLLQLDRDKLKDKPAAEQADLMDIKLIVKWKRKGAADAEFERHPIVLYTRKARL